MSFPTSRTPSPDSKVAADPEKADPWSSKAVPALDGLDIGAEIIAAGDVNASDEERKAVFKKIDLRLIPLVVVLYALQFGDKISLGYAALMGIRTDLKLVGQQYSWASSLFYAGFLLAEFPAVYLLKRLPLGTFTASVIVVWGAILAMHAVVANHEGLYAVRFLLGFFEAPITPAFMMLISMWYPRFEQGRRASYFLAANGLGTLIFAPIAFGLSGITNSPIENWKILFILFGVITFLVGLFYLYAMPNSQLSVKWLTPREKAVAIDALKENSQGAGNLTFRWYQVREAFCDPRTYIYFLFSACMNIPNGGVTSFGNLVINGFGFGSRISLLLGMPGGAVDIIAKILLMRLSDKYKDRTLFASIAICFPFMGGLIMMFAPQDNAGPLLFGYYCISAAGASWGLMMICISNNTIGYTKKSVVNGVQIIAYGVGNWVGPQTFQAKEAPHYQTGKKMVAIFYGISLGLLLLLRLVNILENKKRDRLQAEHPEKYVQDPDAAIKDLTDFEQPDFRYIL